MYLSDLAGLSITGSLHLVTASLGKANAEHSQGIIISGLNIHMSFNESLPFTDQRPELVSGEIHTLQIERSIHLTETMQDNKQLNKNVESEPYIKVGEDILALNIFSPQPNLPESIILITLKISQ